jgi:membrane-anchored protein YejM (alkaline phosphatase superfamily)
VSSFLQTIKKQIRFWINSYNFNKVTEIKEQKVFQNHQELNYVLITLDSCRYDSLLKADTPILDSYGKIYSAWTPATYTLPAHISFFTGILPMVHENIPYLNRFTKQLFKMHKAGASLGGDSGLKTLNLQASKKDMIHGLKKLGFYTVGSGAANWFDKEILVKNFDDFKYVRAQSAEAQVNYTIKKLFKNANSKRFFSFINFYETHTPYMHYGKDREEYSMNARDHMLFPPQEDEQKKAELGSKLHDAQIKAAEHLDSVLGKFFELLPLNTLVILTADHGEAFGEDGFWGHGIYHPLVMNVPMMCFMISREQPLLDL